ncbi:hypothetical protein K8R78_05870 [bacterium]|nr:hypothetical protein [bacterium]
MPKTVHIGVSSLEIDNQGEYLTFSSRLLLGEKVLHGGIGYIVFDEESVELLRRLGEVFVEQGIGENIITQDGRIDNDAVRQTLEQLEKE